MTAYVARIVVVAQLAAALASADPAPAGPPAPAPADDRALAHLDRGVAAYRAGDFALARAELAAAHELAPDRPNPYRWLALTEVALGDCRSALADVEGFLSRVAADDPRVAEVVALRGRCLGTGIVSVESRPSGATVRVDGGPPIATTPVARLGLRVGVHQLVVDKPGFVAESHPIEVRPTGETFASFELTAEPARAPLYRRWWFWVAAGAVALTAAGLTYELTRGSEARLPVVTCDPSGCRP